jgi:hypothetical protein
MEHPMKPFLAELFGTEMLFLIGGAATLAMGAGAASPAILALFSGVAGIAFVLVTLASRRRRTSG